MTFCVAALNVDVTSGWRVVGEVVIGAPGVVVERMFVVVSRTVVSLTVVLAAIGCIEVVGDGSTVVVVACVVVVSRGVVVACVVVVTFVVVVGCVVVVG